MTNEYSDEQSNFLAAQAWAKTNGLEREWLDSFFQDYTETGSIYNAVQHANREWDL